MIVAYQNTDEDAAAWTAEYYRRTLPGRAAMRRVRITMSSLVAVVVALESTLFTTTIDPALAAIITALAAGTGGMATYLWADYKTRRAPMRRSAAQLKRSGFFENFIGARRTEVLPEGLRTVTDRADALYRWSAVTGVEESETHFVLRFGIAHLDVVPKRAFRDDDHRRQFLALVAHYRSVAAAAAPLAVAAGGAAVGPVVSPSIAPPAQTMHTPGAPWWRNRSSVESHVTDTATQQVSQRL